MVTKSYLAVRYVSSYFLFPTHLSMWHGTCVANWAIRPNRLHLFSLRWLWPRWTCILTRWVSNALLKWRQAHQWSFSQMLREVGTRCVYVFLHSCFSVEASCYLHLWQLIWQLSNRLLRLHRVSLNNFTLNFYTHHTTSYNGKLVDNFSHE